MKISDFDWQIKKPFFNEDLNWLKELQTFRAEVLYEDGLRPEFKNHNNEFCDYDPIDLNSYHIMAKKNNSLIGAMRITILDKDLNCPSKTILGTDNFCSLIKENCLEEKKLSEIGRWVVKKEYRHTLVGFFLAAKAIWLCKKLSLHCFANSGKKLNHILSIFGGKLFNKNPGPYFISKYNDNIFFVNVDFNRVHEKVKKLIFDFAQ